MAERALSLSDGIREITSNGWQSARRARDLNGSHTEQAKDGGGEGEDQSGGTGKLAWLAGSDSGSGRRSGF